MKHWGWAILLFFVVSTTSVLAVDISFSNTPSSLDQTQDFSILVNLTCQSCRETYLRGVFFKGDTTNYFGYTANNNGEWINSASDKSLYFHVSHEDFSDASWSGTLRFKLDPDSQYYSGPGEYHFKIGRYTSANSSATWANQVVISVTGPSPIPTQTPIPTSVPKPNPTTRPTSIPQSPTPKPLTPTLAPIPTSIPKPPTPIPTFTTPTPIPQSPTPIPTPSVLGVQNPSRPPSLVPSLALIFSAFILLGLGTFLVFKKAI